MWRRKVHDYSTLSLTFPSDKFAALAGLAQQEQLAHPGATYLAGLWEDTLICDLMWFAHHDSTLPKQKRAPSWSWAAVEGDIFFFDTPNIMEQRGGRFLEARCHIVHAACWTQGETPFVDQHAGSVTLKSRMRPVSVTGGNRFPRLVVAGSDVEVRCAMVRPPVREYILDNDTQDGEKSLRTSVDVRLVEFAVIEADWRRSGGLSGPSGLRQIHISLVLKSVNSDTLLFERIGFLAWEANDPDLYEGQEETTITII
jgi:hypothetical protein